MTGSRNKMCDAKFVCVYASQVAMCIGANRHKKLGEAAELMWRRLSPDTYDAALRRNGKRTEEEDIAELVQTNPAVSQLVEDSFVACANSDDVAKQYDAARGRLQAVSDLDAEARQLVCDTIKKNLYTTYGTLNETVVLSYVKNVLGLCCRTDSTFYKKQMGEIDGVPWYVGGKIDALSADGKTVIEIKNRINRLFMRQTPVYERVQVQTYLELLGVPNGLLIECFTNEQGCVSSNVVHIDRDPAMWAQDIMPKLKGFVSFLLNLIRNHSLQDKFLNSKRRTHLVKQCMVT